MAGKIRLKMSSKGARDVLKSDPVRNYLLGRGHAASALAKSNAGGKGNFLVSYHVGKNRVRVSVITADSDARVAEAKDRALTRALHAAGG